MQFSSIRVINADARGKFTINQAIIAKQSGGGTPPIGQVITLKGTNSRYVSGENGTVAMTCTRTAPQGWEQFTVVDASGGKIALRSQNKYASSENGTQAITCNRAAIGDWEKFDWITNSEGSISIRGNKGRYISSENGTQAMTCNRTTAALGSWETFRVNQ
ncbi:MAG: lectin [Sphingobacteriales bacterium]|nr:lectin [Sphingobacteriales bacterium]